MSTPSLKFRRSRVWFKRLAVFVFGFFITLTYIPVYTQSVPQIVAEETRKIQHSLKNSERKKAIRVLLRSEIPFDQIYQSIQNDQLFNEVPSGRLEWEYKLNGTEYFALVSIPKSYDPQLPHRVVFKLHGGVLMQDQKASIRYWNRDENSRKSNDIIVYPSSWQDKPWWHKDQYHNIAYLLDRLKASFNVDTNDVHLMGVSDGGTGTFYLANCNPTTWASYVTLIANLSGLKNLSDKQIYASNFQEKPFYSINTELDHMFPPEAVIPYMKLLKEANVSIDYKVIPGEGHTLNWYPHYHDSVSIFQNENQRDPYPDKLYWESESDRAFNRNHWIVIDKLGKTEIDEELPDINLIPIVGYQAFPRDSVSGSLVVNKMNNSVDITSRGIQRITLLLSPDHFNFNEEVTIMINGELHFEEKIERNIKTLLDWYYLDRDPKMLYGAEISITVGREL